MQGICSNSNTSFNEELAGPDNTVVLTVSMDLFCSKRWCGAEGIENAIMLPDYFDHSFGRDYALLINEWHLLARAVFVLDTDNTIRYVEYVDNINSEPNFEAAIAAAKPIEKSSVTKSSLLFETEILFTSKYKFNRIKQLPHTISGVTKTLYRSNLWFDR